MGRKLSEHIVAIPASKINHLADSQGIVEDFELKSDDLILAQREFLETTTEFRQVLPVVVFTYKGLVWAYKRTPKGNEATLHNQVTVAVGGHWDLEDIICEDDKPSDILVQKSLELALSREISEEVSLNGSKVLYSLPLCTLAASVTETDKKHMAFIQRYEMSTTALDAKEEELESMGFMDPKQLLAMHKAGTCKLETWALVALSCL